MFHTCVLHCFVSKEMILIFNFQWSLTPDWQTSLSAGHAIMWCCCWRMTQRFLDQLYGWYLWVLEASIFDSLDVSLGGSKVDPEDRWCETHLLASKCGQMCHFIIGHVLQRVCGACVEWFLQETILSSIIYVGFCCFHICLYIHTLYDPVSSMYDSLYVAIISVLFICSLIHSSQEMQTTQRYTQTGRLQTSTRTHTRDLVMVPVCCRLWLLDVAAWDWNLNLVFFTVLSSCWAKESQWQTR